VTVVDPSAALEVLLNAPLAQRVAQRLFRDGESLHAPHLIDAEVAQVLRRLLRRGEVDDGRAAQLFEDVAGLPLTRYPHAMLLPGIWALRDNATAYDATDLVLTDALGATLVTCDAALASVPGCRAQVQLIR